MRVGILGLGVLAAGCTFDPAGLQVGRDAASGRPADAGADIDAAAPDASVPAPLALAPGDARLVFGVGEGAALHTARWIAETEVWEHDPPAASMSRAAAWVVNGVSIDGAALEVAAVVTAAETGSVLHVFRHRDDGWQLDWTHENPSLGAESRWFDLELEGAGAVVVVFSDGSDVPQFRRFAAGGWSDAAPIFAPDPDAGDDDDDEDDGDESPPAVRWIELERHGESDTLGLAYASEAGHLAAILWDGSSWLGDSHEVLERNLKRNPVTETVGNRAFDLAFETDSGALLVAWGRNDQSSFRFDRHDPATGWLQHPIHDGRFWQGKPHFVDLAPAPAGNRIAVGFYDLGDGTERLALGMWDGYGWQEGGQIDDQIADVNDEAVGDAPGQLLWLGAETALAVYPDDVEGTLDWALWRAEDESWALQDPVEIASKGRTESVFAVSAKGGQRAVVTVSDGAAALYRATFDGTDWQVDADAVDAALSSTTSVPFSLAVRAH